MTALAFFDRRVQSIVWLIDFFLKFESQTQTRTQRALERGTMTINRGRK